MKKLESKLQSTLKEYCRDRLVTPVNSLVGTLIRPGGEDRHQVRGKIAYQLDQSRNHLGKAQKEVTRIFAEFRQYVFSEVKHYFPELYKMEFMTFDQFEARLIGEFERWDKTETELSGQIRDVSGRNALRDLQKTQKELDEPLRICGVTNDGWKVIKRGRNLCIGLLTVPGN